MGGGARRCAHLRIFHSDVKPSNVVIESAKQDFTLASQRPGWTSTDAVDVGKVLSNHLRGGKGETGGEEGWSTGEVVPVSARARR